MDNKLLVITSYPPSGKIHHRSVIGGASYTKSTLLELKKELLSRNEKAEIIVLAEKMTGQKAVYREKGILIKRVWKKDDLFLFLRLFKEIRIPSVKKILIELELTMFGNNPAMLLLLTLFILSLKLSGKKVLIVFHQVISDFSEVSRHMNIKPEGIRSSLADFSFHLFYRILLLLIDRAVVLDEVLKRKLSHFGRTRKITVIPLATEDRSPVFPKNRARQELDLNKSDFIILSFGFLAWYKGSDWLAKKFARIPKGRKIKLILAGGENPNRTPYAYYRKYLSDLKEFCAKHNILLTGFIPEEKLSLYFSASDLVLFPYRGLFSSSASLSLAFSFRKPLLLSERMQNLFLAPDMKEVLLRTGLRKEDLLFPLNDRFYKKISGTTSEDLRKFRAFSAGMAKERSWGKIRKLYYSLLFEYDK